MTTPAPDKPADAAPQPRDVASRKPASKKAPSKKVAAPKRKQSAKAAPKKAAKPKRKATAPAKSKNEIILGLIGRKSGATLAAIMAATDWQAHSVRGFISLAQSKRGLKVVSTKNKSGERVYRVGK
jgi:outer membrane biosynthesis protein TonB